MKIETKEDALFCLYAATQKERHAKRDKDEYTQRARDFGASTSEIAAAAGMSRQGIRKSLKRLDNPVTQGA